MISAGSP
ncbi:hypothetical protein YPPY98_4362, partial [Yersinia pestis PY-98]